MDSFSDDPTPIPKDDPTWLLIAGALAAKRHPGLEPHELIRALRRGSTTKQKEIAAMTGMRQARVSEIESGRARPRWDEIRAILEALGCKPLLLATGAGYQHRGEPGDFDQ